MLILLILQLSSLLYKSDCVPIELIGPEGLLIKEVPYGESVLLKCRSNEGRYNFNYWMFSRGSVVIGPSNTYDKSKYRYEILSGNLTIRGVTDDDQGLYSCVSREVNGGHVRADHVQLRVIQAWPQVYEHDSNINTIRTLIVLIAVVILAIGGYYAYTVWKDRFRHPGYLEQEDEDDDDDSAEEIFTAPSTSGISSKSTAPKPTNPIVYEKPNSSNFDNISTDFKSILDMANDK